MDIAMNDAKKLKWANFDGMRFNVFFDGEFDKMADLEKNHDVFIFHRCVNGLERFSIRNASFYHRFKLSTKLEKQNLLIKFVRNAPSTLKWFRSDLTDENIDMLRMERPGIELVN